MYNCYNDGKMSVRYYLQFRFIFESLTLIQLLKDADYKAALVSAVFQLQPAVVQSCLVSVTTLCGVIKWNNMYHK